MKTLCLILALLAVALTGCDTPSAPPPRREPPPPSRPVITPPPATSGYVPSSVTPPAVPREFRAAWISSVGENSWLAGLTGRSSAEQRAALVAMIDRAAQLKLNAIIFQVRPACDALYVSSIEPWSEHLTGVQGRAPNPVFDPLAVAIEEAHKRGLELHAWFNPYRARHADSKSPIAANHISRTRPDLVRTYGKYLWLDPGERDVQDHSLRVILDVVKRYDVDGVHIDDYFYPYREKDAAGREVDFPDAASWKKFGLRSKLSRDDWRRENVNTFVQRLNSAVHNAKPGVKFGISPFGIWRPGQPAPIRGLDAYTQLYADARKWLQNGWADYFAPQLYWNIATREQSFPVLLQWWNEQNARRRHLWPGLDASKVSGAKWQPEEITAQVRYTRQLNPPGAIYWGLKNLMPDHAGLGDVLARELYTGRALVPATPWLATGASPARPLLTATRGNNSVKLTWAKSDAVEVRAWVLQRRMNGAWFTDVLPGNRTGCEISGQPEVIAVTALDRISRTGLPAAVQMR